MKVGILIVTSKVSFQKQLRTIIDSFEKAKEWADLSNCLQKVKRLFLKYPNCRIPEK
jgi:hypothetical protein